MNDSALHRSYIGEGDSAIFDTVDQYAKAWVGEHYLWASALIVALTFVCVYLYFRKESFNPTQTLRMSDSDQFGLGAKREGMDGGEPECENDQADDSGAWSFQISEANKKESMVVKPKTDNDFSRILSGN